MRFKLFKPSLISTQIVFYRTSKYFAAENNFVNKKNRMNEEIDLYKDVDKIHSHEYYEPKAAVNDTSKV